MRSSLLAITLALSVTTHVDAAEVRTVEWQGLERHYRLHNAAEKPRPLILHLHGYRKQEQAINDRETLDGIGWSDIERVAVEAGAMVVSPAALRGQWSLFPGLKNAKKEDGTELDDAGLIFWLVQRLVDQGLADPARMYLTGISDGAIFIHRLLCDERSRFAAAVPLVGSMAEVHREGCAPDPVPGIMTIAGTNDRILPWDGWLFGTGRELSVPDTMDHWRRLHGCTRQKWEELPDTDPEDGSVVRKVWWTNCEAEVEQPVVLMRVEGGGHRVPRPLREDEKRDPRRNSDIDSAEEAWRFLSGFEHKVR